MFDALLLEKTEAGFQAGVRSLDESRLPVPVLGASLQRLKDQHIQRSLQKLCLV